MRIVLRAAVLWLTVSAASAAWAERPQTLAQFIGLGRSAKGGGCCPTSCCSTPAPKPAPLRPAYVPAACQPHCAPAPTCEPQVCEPACCPPPACGCAAEACASCCPNPCGGCCPREYPLERLLNNLDRLLFRKKDCCQFGCDPYGYDLWPAVGVCCQGPATHGHGTPPAVLDPELLRPQGEETIDPFQDDPVQPLRPLAPTRGAAHRVKRQAVYQRSVR